MRPELGVLVPVLGRPANVEPLVASFLENCPSNSRLIFLATDGDEQEIDVLGGSVDNDRTGYDVGSYVTWGQKINAGISVLGPYWADWYLCAADDVRFTEGWWDATAELRANPTVGVIGTNDSGSGSGNPRVAAGDHTCHPLVRASYIRDAGTVDQPGLAVHPGYQHWFVDDELVWTAKLRGAWAFCRDAVIEHLHPYWGYGEWDATYAKGEANAEADAVLWRERAKLLGLQVV